MNILDRTQESHNIARRYLVVNGFDGALTMLGIIVGFYFSDNTSIGVVINACMGAAVALGISGISSAYVSELAERKKELRELEEAMVLDLSESTHDELSKTIPIYVAIVNGVSPFIISIVILTPLLLAHKFGINPIDPLLTSSMTAFIIIFIMGIFLGKISSTFWLWSGLRTLMIALATTSVIYFIS